MYFSLLFLFVLFDYLNFKVFMNMKNISILIFNTLKMKCYEKLNIVLDNLVTKKIFEMLLYVFKLKQKRHF
jgi:hypothetical protein